jgi:hypothetical protein
VLAWLDALVDLPNLLLGGHAHTHDWRESLIQTVPILVIWGVVYLLTRRLLAHVLYLEGFLRVCAWCRKVGHGDKWMWLEDYFAEGFHVATTHGMCPECLKKMEEDTKEYYRRKVHAEAKSEESASLTER